MASWVYVVVAGRAIERCVSLSMQWKSDEELHQSHCYRSHVAFRVDLHDGRSPSSKNMSRDPKNMKM
ncbi:hypothetical protein PAXRUDRAFT_832077 [Paxillus rubicundulus Ve08.2h10]|uniref:Uncharacterized protein n=1 Tax=Paxillus rubicundulus Ve08.2h10 TaxID=930991 RepID=A0A0D0D4W1_9AGAM|nr:hypothetical protein PAXRUDRAFT_832077 [Paxillus rubicundulus Ve08.2h10]